MSDPPIYEALSIEHGVRVPERRPSPRPRGAPMPIIARSQWGAAHEDGFGDAPLPARELYLHHSVTIAPDLVPPFDDDDAAIRTLERIGEDRFGRGISYTFAITPVGRIYEGHGIGRQGAHTARRNSIARAICLVGNYDRDRPSEAMVNAAAWLVGHGHRQGWWPARLTGGHRDAPGASTACPGRHAYALIAEINRRAALEEDDMFTDADRALLQRVHHEATLFLDNRREPGSDKPKDTVLGFAASAEGRAARIERYALRIAEQQDAILAALAGRNIDPAEIAARLIDAGIGRQVAEQLISRISGTPVPASSTEEE